MSRADELFVQMCGDILENGYSSRGQKVRARWELSLIRATGLTPY